MRPVLILLLEHIELGPVKESWFLPVVNTGLYQHYQKLLL
jgi:hypothetical protein